MVEQDFKSSLTQSHYNHEIGLVLNKLKKGSVYCWRCSAPVDKVVVHRDDIENRISFHVHCHEGIYEVSIPFSILLGVDKKNKKNVSIIWDKSFKEVNHANIIFDLPYAFCDKTEAVKFLNKLGGDNKTYIFEEEMGEDSPILFR